jgi:hypothetical protein
MIFKKRCGFILLALAILSFCLSGNGLAQSISVAVEGVTTTDLSNNIKSAFNPEDPIRYTISYSAKRVALFFARGIVVFTGASEEKLKLQFQTVRKGDYKIYWDSIVPKSALGTATVNVRYFSFPGGFGSSSASFTVKEKQPLPEATYLGSSICILCHGSISNDIVDAYLDSGHHFALKKIIAAAPEYPSFAPGVPEPPATFQWNDILYAVGGYGWKAYYVNLNGFLLTNGIDDIDAQYNLPSTFLKTSGQFVSYADNQTVPKPFDCGPCHTTGYSASGNQNNISGLVGTWKEDGVGCEACHGPGSNHATFPSSVSPPDDPAQACVNCHVRDNKTVVESENGLILDQQQSDELLAGAKFYFECVSCHDPHASAHYNGSASGSGIIQECTNCHTNVSVGLGMQFLRCIDCHMPYAVNSGAQISYQDTDENNLIVGNVRTHVFTINAAAQSPAEMFSPDGKTLAVGSDGRAKGLTLNFVCQSCHRTGGFAATTYSFEQAKSLAPFVHISPPVKNGYIGSALCIACHSGSNKDITDAYLDSGHHFALNAVPGDAPVYPPFAPGVPQPPATFQWSDIQFVAGGYGWKANFVNNSGYIITNGNNKIDSQYNLPDTFLTTSGQFVPYETTLKTPKLFNCGSCHATGYTAEGNQDGLTGIVGTWAEDGVGCEACHGPGEQHLNDPFGVKPAGDAKQSCKLCHVRDNSEVLEAENGLILHQQQAEEIAASAKSFLTCDACHNPHASAHYDQKAAGTGIIVECTTCHPGKTVGLGMQFLKCVDCHMPYAVKSGANISYQDSNSTALKLGDVRSHLFTIYADANSPSDMFTVDGLSVATDGNSKAKGLTLNFICLSCHRQGGLAATTYTFEQVKALAGAVHTN